MAEPLTVGTAPPTPALRRRPRFIGLSAGLLSGVLNAAVARVLMRIVALIEFGQGSFSVAGTGVTFMFGLLVYEIGGRLLGIVNLA